MCTRSTLAHGERHHLFVDLLRSGEVYLTLEKSDFEAHRDRVTVAIPLDVWEQIRHVEVRADDWWDDDDDPSPGQGNGAPNPEPPDRSAESGGP
ncbi:hypothetical protein [Tautonia marina]|uniref:hypothetical protein n=1 Tax=Tautonia marina TaxID=2653855 RepID=UPI0012610B5D|nr:hypothetical protein [Tautonia marina]